MSSEANPAGDEEEPASEQAWGHALDADRISMQTIVDAVPAMIFFKDTENRIIRLNKAAADQMGHPRKDIEGRHTREFFPDHEIFFEADKRVLDSGESELGIIEPIRHDSGAMSWSSTDKVPIHDANGQICGLIVVANDITELKAAQSQLSHRLEDLEKASSRLRIATETTGIGHWRVDVSTGITEVTEEFSRQLGMPHPAIRSYEEWARLVHPEDLATAAEQFRSHIDSGDSDVYEAEFRMRHADGTFKWILSRGFANRNAEGKAITVDGIHLDITDRKDSETKLQSLVDDLERSNEELAEFAYVASHDLQEPLRKITAFGELLQQDCGESISDDGKRYLQHMIDGGTRMRQLIKDLLEYSRAQTEPVNCHPFNILDPVEGAVEINSRLIAERNVSVTIDCSHQVLADDPQIERVFQNLITNSIRYCQSEKPVVQITSHQHAAGVLVHVDDNGIGIDQQYRDQVFGVFKRLHSRKDFPGSGIGLAICRRTIRRFGGEIWIEDSPLGGTRMCFVLPSPEAPSETTTMKA